jgi:hypothetical protein
MGENDTKNTVSEAGGSAPEDAFESFVLDETVSSASILREAEVDNTDASVLPGLAAEDELDFENRSPIFKELALPKLPELRHENRARLLMQSPNRLFFYWSTRGNPFRTLHRAFGERTENYTLVLKFIDLKKGTEDLYPVEAEGSWWFDVETDGSYRAELGFYAPNGPYVRILFSNKIETPRKSPSPRVATSADWTVNSATFAEVLDASGFSQDAFEVAMAGDDQEQAKRATHAAFTGLVGAELDLSGFSPEELRFALLALASGVSLEKLRDHIGGALFALLQMHEAEINAGRANEALGEHFGVSSDDIVEEERIGSAVFGASRVHFPRLTIRRGDLAKLSPISSLRAGLS